MTSPETTWGAGEYPLMARLLEPAARATVEAVDIGPGDRVIDVATGTGNAALLAAERGGEVVGVDLEPALLAEASERARQAGCDIRWVRSDLASMPVADGSADVVLSVFGVMYAADHAAAVRELARVAAPGARIALTAWVPGSLIPAMGQVFNAYLPPPPLSTGPPSRWGDADAVRELLEGNGLRMRAADERRLVLRFADAPEATEFLLRTAGNVISEKQRLTRDGRWVELCAGLRAFVEQRGELAGGGFALAADYLLVTARSSGISLLPVRVAR